MKCAQHAAHLTNRASLVVVLEEIKGPTQKVATTWEIKPQSHLNSLHYSAYHYYCLGYLMHLARNLWEEKRKVENKARLMALGSQWNQQAHSISWGIPAYDLRCHECHLSVSLVDDGRKYDWWWLTIWLMMAHNMTYDGSQYDLWWLTIWLMMAHNMTYDGSQYDWWWLTVWPMIAPNMTNDGSQYD